MRRGNMYLVIAFAQKQLFQFYVFSSQLLLNQNIKEE